MLFWNQTELPGDVAGSDPLGRGERTVDRSRRVPAEQPVDQRAGVGGRGDGDGLTGKMQVYASSWAIEGRSRVGVGAGLLECRAERRRPPAGTN